MGLTDILSPKVRQVLYAVYGFLGLGLGAVQVAYSAAGDGQPEWLTVVLAVFAFLGVGLGFTAAANTTTGRVASDADVATDITDGSL
jgi:hypothetical protein